MSDSVEEPDDFHVVTDQDFAKYRLQSAPHLWKPLQGPRGIRLLKIFSKTVSHSSSEDRISCRLENWNIDQATGRYEALSYAWGQPGNGFDYIECDNITTKVWRNLHQALLRLRDKISGGNTHRSRLIWVDALCIDQTNMQERQSQILLMKNIFGFASQVIIWLGEHDKASQQVWKSVSGIKPGSTREIIRNVMQWNVKMSEIFIRRPWFRRVWTIQEVVLSAKAMILCGNDEMDWTTFCTIWKNRYEFMKNLKPEIRERRVDHIEESLAFIGLMHCFDIQQQRSGNGDERSRTLPLSKTLIRTWYREATDPLDRIYALLGLIELSEYAVLEKPDYSQSPLRLFTDVTKAAMRADKTPELLNIAGISIEDATLAIDMSGSDAVPYKSEPRTLYSTARPSWVPNWSKHGWENNWLVSRLASDERKASLNPYSLESTGNPDTWIPEFEGDKLRIRGHIVGYIPRRSSTETSTTITVAGLSFGSSAALSWKSNRDGKEYSVTRSKLPFDGETTREDDVVCAFVGMQSLFLVRMMFSFDFSTWGALEWLKEDIQYKGLKMDCLLVGPIQLDDMELAERPSDGHWEFIIH